MKTDDTAVIRKDLNNYLLAGRISNELNSLLIQEQELLGIYCDPLKLCKPLTLTIGRFDAGVEMEDTVIRWLHRIISDIECFPVHLRRYGSLLGSKIYLESVSSKELNAFASHLAPIDSYIRNHDCPALQVCSQPHIMMVENLNPREFEQTFTNFRLRKFSEEYILSELLLLRKDPGSEEYKQIVLLRLQPQNNRIAV